MHMSSLLVDLQLVIIVSVFYVPSLNILVLFCNLEVNSKLEQWLDDN